MTYPPEQIEVASPAPAPRRSRAAVAVAAGGAALVIAVAVGVGVYLGRDDDQPAPAANASAATHAPLPLLVRGQFTLELGQFAWSETTHACTGWQAYDDINPGSQVVITDRTGATVALGELGVGQPVMQSGDATRAQQCFFTFDIRNVPSGKGFYGIEVARHGRVEFAEAKLAERVRLGLQ